ncbi:MAG: hypothetical protein M1834_007406 [Cirrosporium novae-zelandiae]|nr:MAG: hypothetical protein M1834_007406 [Cirrosporium novae-zelandiae]
MDPAQRHGHPTGGHRGVDLPPLQTSFPSKTTRRLQRPRPDESEILDQSANRIPLTPVAPTVKRQASRSNLRNLFSRSKSTKKYREEKMPPIPAEPEEEPFPTLTPARRTFSRRSTMKSQREPSVPSPPPTVRTVSESRLKYSNSKKTVRSKTSKNEKAARDVGNWDPPPLFQAYPQAVKHATLMASNLSAESIMRICNHRRNPSIREEMMRSSLDMGAHQNTPELRKKDAKAKKHRRKVSGSFSRAEWTEKVYVLITSGYLLQYAGDGTFDRLPEKIMQLTKDSVAFASDVIPGKPYVLQVLPSREGAIMEVGLLSRLGIRTAQSRRNTSCFLLICETAEDLASWLAAVKKEIETLGGKRFRSTSESHQSEEDKRKLYNRQSRMFLVNRDPNQFGSAQSLHDADNRTFSRSFSETSLNNAFNRRSVAGRSFEAPSVSATSISTDQLALDQLRNGSRLSYMSNGSHTIPTSRASSPARSPIMSTSNHELPLPPVFGNSLSISDMRPLPSQRRRSVQALPQNLDDQRRSTDAQSPTKSPRPHSTYSPSENPVAYTTPNSPTPNFSVPSFSKRYSFTSQVAVPPSQTPAKTIHASTTPWTKPKESSTNAPKSDQIQERPGSVLGPLPLNRFPSRAKSPRDDQPRHSIQQHFEPSFSQPSIRPMSSKSYRCFTAHDISQQSSAPPYPPPVTALPALPPLPRPTQPRDRDLSPKRPTSAQSPYEPNPMWRPASAQSRHRPFTFMRHRNDSHPPAFQSIPILQQPFPASQANTSRTLHSYTSLPEMNPPPARPPPTVPLPDVPPIVISDGYGAKSKYRSRRSSDGGRALHSQAQIMSTINERKGGRRQTMMSGAQPFRAMNMNSTRVSPALMNFI